MSEHAESGDIYESFEDIDALHATLLDICKGYLYPEDVELVMHEPDRNVVIDYVVGRLIAEGHEPLDIMFRDTIVENL